MDKLEIYGPCCIECGNPDQTDLTSKGGNAEPTTYYCVDQYSCITRADYRDNLAEIQRLKDAANRLEFHTNPPHGSDSTP